jgi:hypothetical protein
VIIEFFVNADALGFWGKDFAFNRIHLLALAAESVDWTFAYDILIMIGFAIGCI